MTLFAKILPLATGNRTQYLSRCVPSPSRTPSSNEIRRDAASWVAFGAKREWRYHFACHHSAASRRLGCAESFIVTDAGSASV